MEENISIGSFDHINFIHPNINLKKYKKTWGTYDQEYAGSGDDVGDVDRKFHCSEEKLNAFLIFVFVSHIVICMQGTTPKPSYCHTRPILEFQLS